MPVETGLIKKNLRDLTERATSLTGVSLTTTARRSGWRKSALELELPDVWNKPERAQELGRERARLSADLEQLDGALAGADQRQRTAGDGRGRRRCGLGRRHRKGTAAARVARARAGVPAHVPRRDGCAQRLPRHPGRRRRHRGPGLGADADAHVPALGRGARLQDRGAWIPTPAKWRA